MLACSCNIDRHISWAGLCELGEGLETFINKHSPRL